MKTKINVILVLALVSFMLTSCSSNDDDVALQQENLSEVVMQDFIESVNAINVPEALASSNNSFAQQANIQFTSVKAIATSFALLFTVPDNALAAKSTNKLSAKSSFFSSQTYTWSQDGVTVKYTISESSDRYRFLYDIVSPDFTGKVMEGYQLKDGSYAEAKLFSGTNESVTLKWWVTQETSKFEIGLDGSKLVLESNSTDNSGNLKIYEDATLIALFEWNADGSGKFTDFVENETFTW